MKGISYLDMIKELLNESEFFKFQECYAKPIKKSIKILNHRWFKNQKSDLRKIVHDCISQERNLSESNFSYNWKKYNDVIFITRKENLKSASIWSHFLHQAWFIYVQEMAASLPVQVLWIQPWDTVLDMCAAPWWKSIQIADILNDWFLISNEIDSGRRKALESNFHRCWIFNVWVIGQDWCTLWDKFPETFDKVLVDAPCSWEWMQYKSDKKVWQRDEKKSKKLSDLQIKLLTSWLKSLKVWWELVYSTCTTNILENEYVVSEVLKQHSGKIELSPVPSDQKSNWIPNWRWKEIISLDDAKKVARFRPHIHQTWWFFIAKFKKLESFSFSGWKEFNNIESYVSNTSLKIQLNLIDNELLKWWILDYKWLGIFISKYTVNIAPRSLINSCFETLIPSIEIWLPIFKIINDNKNNSQKLIPLPWLAKIFWHLATKNVIEIDNNQLKLLMEKKDLVDNRLTEYEWNYIILTRNWFWIWLVSVQKWIWKNKCF